MRDADDLAVYLQGDCLDLTVRHRRLRPALVGERVGVALGDVAVLADVHHAVGRKLAAVNVFGLEDDDVTLLDVARYRRGDGDEPVAGIQRRLHAPSLDVRDEGGLAEDVPEHQRDQDDDQDNREGVLCYALEHDSIPHLLGSDAGIAAPAMALRSARIPISSPSTSICLPSN